MRVSIVLIMLLGYTTWSWSQNPENLIPSESVVAFSINNVSLLDKISLDDLIQYDFMEEVQSELFNGSTKGKNLRDSGIDFKKRINLFSGKNRKYELSGVTFGVTNIDSILKVFDNFDEISSHFPQVKIFRNNLNYMFVKDNQVLIVRVEPDTLMIKEVTDSLWLARGNGYYYYPLDDFDTPFDDAGDNGDPADIIDSTANPNANPEIADSTLNGSSVSDYYEQLYWDLRDSVNYEYQQTYIRELATELFIAQKSLVSEYAEFEQQLQKPVDAIFYFDNERNISNSKGIWQFQNIFPSLFSDAGELYQGNVLTGEMNLVKNSFVFDFQAEYNDKLEKIYSNLTDAKFVKSFSKYIHKDALGYFTYNVNLKNCFNTSFDVIMNLLQGETNKKVLSNMFIAEILNEFVDVDNIFDTYQGSMFGSVNGVKTITTKYFDYSYDENTFEYTEKEMEKNRDIPNVTIGFKTLKPDFLARMAKLLAKTRPDVINHGSYYEIKDAILHMIPCYFAIVDDVVLFSVDENLFLTHLNGYAKSERINIKKAKKSKFTYMYLDVDKALNNLPKEALSERQNDILRSIVNKSGVVELKSLGSKKNKTKFELNYSFDGEETNTGKHLLDLINSLYLFTKN